MERKEANKATKEIVNKFNDKIEQEVSWTVKQEMEGTSNKVKESVFEIDRTLKSFKENIEPYYRGIEIDETCGDISSLLSELVNENEEIRNRLTILRKVFF